MAKSDTSPENKMNYSSVRLLKKALIKGHESDASSIIESAFGVKIEHTTVREDNKTVTRVLVKRGSAVGRRRAMQALQKIQEELIKRENSHLKDKLLHKPLNYLGSSYAERLFLDECDIKRTEQFLNSLFSNKVMIVSKQSKDIETQERKAEIDQVKTLIKNKRNGYIKKVLDLNRTQRPLKALEEILSSLMHDISEKKFKHIDEYLMSQIGEYNRQLETDRYDRLEKRKEEIHAHYKTVSSDEKDEMRARIVESLKAKNIYDVAPERLDEYTRNAFFDLRTKGIVYPHDVIDVIDALKREQEAKQDQQVAAQSRNHDGASAEERAQEDARMKEHKDAVLILDKETKKKFVPRNETQAAQIRAMMGGRGGDKRGALHLAVGPAGTGKTATAVAYALAEYEAGRVKTIIITTPPEGVGGKTSGFLPGDEIKKMGPHIRQVLRALVKFGGKPRIKKMMGLSSKPEAQHNQPTILDDILNEHPLQILPLEFVRGLDLPDAIIIVDEAQNMDMATAEAITTRAGRGTQVIMCGDPAQTDVPVMDSRGEFIKDFSKLPCLPVMTRHIDRHPLANMTVYPVEHVVRGPLTKASVSWFSELKANSTDIIRQEIASYKKVFGYNKGMTGQPAQPANGHDKPKLVASNGNGVHPS